MKKIEEICREESRVSARQQWLVVLFFLASIIVAFIYVKALLSPAASPPLVIEHDQAVVAKIFITLTIFAGGIIAGYFYYQALSKRLDGLWEKKKELF